MRIFPRSYGANVVVQRFIVIIALVVLFGVFSITTPKFFTLQNVITVALQTSTLAFMGIGVTYVIITGGIDLSIGSVLALSGVIAGLASRAGVSVWVSFLLGLIVGIGCGIVNGFLVTAFDLPPFIATLGMMQIARGIALQITGARAVAGLPAAFGILGNGALWRTENFPGIPYPVVIMIAIALVFDFVLRRHRIGRFIYAVGSNEEAARLSGINVNRTKIIAYIVSGTLAGLTGIVVMSRIVTAQPNAGVAYELDAIATAVIGGTSLMGGSGTISGTMIGAFIVGILRNGLNMRGVSYFIQQIIIGLVIVAAVTADRLQKRRQGR
ncbi:MAG: ABC transporter permease [Atribacterota bacterium]